MSQNSKAIAPSRARSHRDSVPHQSQRQGASPRARTPLEVHSTSTASRRCFLAVHELRGEQGEPAKDPAEYILFAIEISSAGCSAAYATPATAASSFPSPDLRSGPQIRVPSLSHNKDSQALPCALRSRTEIASRE